MSLTKETIQRIDSQGMWKWVTEFPEQWRHATRIIENIDLTIKPDQIANVCFAGMGSSALGADLLRGYTIKSCPYPVQVIRHYDIPNWVNDKTLFVSCSYSGNTEETLSALDKAIEKGAQVVAVASGGRLLVKAQKEGFDYIKIPNDMPTRAGLAYNFVSLYGIFQHLGYLDEGEAALTETHILLEKGVAEFADFSSNEALTIAEELNHSLPIIYSDAMMMEAVNIRWCTQIQENAKMLAYGNLIPEMSHNEIVGWEQIVHLTGRLNVVLLKDKEDSLRVTRRMEIIKELVIDQALSVIEIDTYGESRLARLFSLVQLSDWVSLYLALINEIDPTPTAKIDLLKSKLSEVNQ